MLCCGKELRRGVADCGAFDVGGTHKAVHGRMTHRPIAWFPRNYLQVRGLPGTAWMDAATRRSLRNSRRRVSYGPRPARVLIIARSAARLLAHPAPCWYRRAPDAMSCACLALRSVSVSSPAVSLSVQ